METSIQLPKRARTCVLKYVDRVLEYLPMTFAHSEWGAGRKVFIQIPTKNNPNSTIDYVYVYAESKLPDKPKNADVGFTEEDIMDLTGIYVYRREGKHILGQVFPLETFLTEIITDLSMRNRIIYKVNEMKTMIRLDADFLELANLEMSSNTRPIKRYH